MERAKCLGIMCVWRVKASYLLVKPWMLNTCHISMERGTAHCCGLHHSSVLSLPRISSPYLVPYFCFSVPQEHIECRSTLNPVFSLYTTMTAPCTHHSISQHLKGMDAVVICIVYALCWSYKRLSTNTLCALLEGLYSFQVSTG